jgi:hypothetical protein
VLPALFVLAVFAGIRQPHAHAVAPTPPLPLP